MLPLDVKQFIEENIDHIQQGNFDLLYERALGTRTGINNVGQFTDVLLAAGIDPLDHMDMIPPLYLDGSCLGDFEVPLHIKVARKSAFAFSNILEIKMHKDLELSDSCFHNSKLKSVIIPYIMNEVPEECFYNSVDLEDVDLNAIEQIGYEAFAYCAKLGKIFIPDDINFIAPSAFNECPNLVFLIHNNNEYALDYAQKHK